MLFPNKKQSFLFKVFLPDCRYICHMYSRFAWFYCFIVDLWQCIQFLFPLFKRFRRFGVVETPELSQVCIHRMEGIQPQNRTNGTSARSGRFYAILRGLDFNISNCQQKPVNYDKADGVRVEMAKPVYEDAGLVAA